MQTLGRHVASGRKGQPAMLIVAFAYALEYFTRLEQANVACAPV